QAAVASPTVGASGPARHPGTRRGLSRPTLQARLVSPWVVPAVGAHGIVQHPGGSVAHRALKSPLLVLLLVAIVLPTGLRAQGQGPGGREAPPPAAAYRSSLMAGLQNHMQAISALVSGDVAYMGHIQLHAA